MDIFILVSSVAIPAVVSWWLLSKKGARSFGLVFPVTIVWAAAIWVFIGAEILPMPMIWGGLYGNAFALLSLMAIPLIWLAALAYAATVRTTAAASGREFDPNRMRGALTAAAGLPPAFLIHYAMVGFRVPHAEAAALLYIAILFRTGLVLTDVSSPGKAHDGE